MLKKIGIFLVLCCAFAGFLAHNIIPHHHHDEKSHHHASKKYDYKNQDKHKSNNEDDGYDHTFVDHSVDFGTAVVKHFALIEQSLGFDHIDIDFLVPTVKFAIPAKAPPDKIILTFSDPHFLTSEQYFCLGLRAPPVKPA